MILGASHAVVGCASIDGGLRQLSPLGYRIGFVDRELPNFSGKNRFLSRPHAMHRIAYTRAPAGLLIELVSYDEMAKGDVSGYAGIFSDRTYAERQKV